MKKITILLLVFFVLCSSACYAPEKKPEEKNDDIYVSSDGSWFSRFEVVGEVVNFYCRLRIRNETNDEHEILVYGNFAEDVEGGLVKETRLLGRDTTNPTITTFWVSPGDTDIQIVFSGTFAGRMHKRNHLLPGLEIVSSSGDTYTNNQNESCTGDG